MKMLFPALLFLSHAALSAAVPVEQKELNPELEEALSLRDPFQRPLGAEPETEVILSELERYPLDQFKLVGVITGASRLRAILQDPSGHTHFVAERMRVGNRRGVIRKIRSDAVVVREKTVNILGREEFSDNEIRLSDEAVVSKGSSG